MEDSETKNKLRVMQLVLVFQIQVFQNSCGLFEVISYVKTRYGNWNWTNMANRNTPTS